MCEQEFKSSNLKKITLKFDITPYKFKIFANCFYLQNIILLVIRCYNQRLLMIFPFSQSKLGNKLISINFVDFISIFIYFPCNQQSESILMIFTIS